MDQRQAQIREGAGLEESRLNVEFIDFLKKWSTPVLVVIALVAIGYLYVQKRREHRAQTIATAFNDLDAARESGDPNALIAVARDWHGEGTIPQIAETAAADVYLSSYRSGVQPWARFDNTGKLEDPTGLLSDEERSKQLDHAAQLYQQVVDETAGNQDRAIHTIGALFGLAAVAECRGKVDEARGYLERVQTLARNLNMSDQEKLASTRLETLGGLTNLPRVYAQADIPVSAASKIPEGLVPLGSNPFGAATSATAPTIVGPQAPTPAPPATTGEPVKPVPVQEPETASPGGSAPDAKPAKEPATPPTPTPTPAPAPAPTNPAPAPSPAPPAPKDGPHR